jgi:hypothetical protein
MNITEVARQWLIEHEHYEHDPSFQDDLLSLCKVIEDAVSYASEGGWVGYEDDYDASVGDDTLCICGHTYYRHFDPYEHMDPVGCKYCNHYTECTGFKAQ